MQLPHLTQVRPVVPVILGFVITGRLTSHSIVRVFRLTWMHVTVSGGHLPEMVYVAAWCNLHKLPRSETDMRCQERRRIDLHALSDMSR